MGDAGAVAANLQQPDTDSFGAWLAGEAKREWDAGCDPETLMRLAWDAATERAARVAEKVGESELITPLIAARIRGGAA